LFYFLGSVKDADLKTLSMQLHLNDVNAVKGIVLNLQNQTKSGDTTDRAPLPYYNISKQFHLKYMITNYNVL